MISFYQHYINPFFKLWHHFGLRIALNEVSFVLHRKRCPATHGKDMQTIRKYYSLIRYLGSKYKEIIDPYVEIRPKQWNGKIIEENAPIWTFWEQGFEKAPLKALETVPLEIPSRLAISSMVAISVTSFVQISLVFFII